MIERRPVLDMISHLVLILGVMIVAFPIYIALVASSQTAEQAALAPLSLIPGDQLFNNLSAVLQSGASGNVSAGPVLRMLWISLASALIIAIGKISISMLSAFAMVYFRFPGRSLFFWMIFVTLMLPVEVRITPTYKVVSDLGMLNSYAGLTIPLIASATATFLFRQFFLTVPDELAEAARIDGAGPLRFFKDVLWPLSRTNVVALFVIMFIYGWNQYLWPLLISTEQGMYPIGVGIRRMIAGGDAAVEWNMVMATLLLAMLPPAMVVILMQKWFVKGLVDSEK
ncbi:sn-glycerol-3-phosphate ABC transporter permease UgpE [Undibacterium terreum]|uniref:sn-glycerol-3-phosphate transport system permease protein UgpE n=1 Tax=Undibacterium terreum TaxID=1224302 RepID=A0A916UNJ2_9BURK|nr:sn-glycerol-3-phosphate ABC transporter permease UgpE [Undibacterium terreum]GGC79449.1 sn-glycerol-3-phosphate transport system permease protein UgpE [Undibacterium terreum]